MIYKYRYGIIISIGILAFIIYFTIASFLRYDNFYAGRFDLGNMAQTVWNTSQGRIFQLTDPNGTETVSRLATHADFILILLAPFYYIWQNPKILLLLQSIIVSLGGIFIYLLARDIIKSRKIAVVFTFLFLFNPSVQRTVLYDFHPVVLATTFLLGAFYYLLRKKYLPFLFFAILAALTKEQVWLLVAFFGIYLIIKDKKIIFGTILGIVSLSILAFLFSYAIPNAAKGSHFVFSYYYEYGDKPAGIAKNIISNPGKIIQTISSPQRRMFLFQLLAPLGFMPLFAPLFLLFPAPELLLYLLSTNQNTYQIYYQYTATITPFLFIASIYAYAYLMEKLIKFKRYLIILVFSFAFIMAYIFSPLPFSREPNTAMFTNPYKNRDIVIDYLKKIPKNYSVAATNNLGAHLSNRENIFTIPIGIEKADIIAFLLNDPSAQPSLIAQINMAKNLKMNKKYVLLFEKDDFVVFKKVVSSL